KLSLDLQTNIRNIYMSFGTLLELIRTQSLANVVNIDYAELIWEDIITKLNKKTKEKVFPYTSLQCSPLTLKKNQPEAPPFIDHILTICNANVPVEHKAPNTSSYTRKKDFKGKNPGAKSGHMKQPTSSKHHPWFNIKATKGGSSKAPTGSKTIHLVKETQSSSALDTNSSQPLESTLVQTKFASEGLETVLIKPATGKGASHIEQEVEEEFNTSLDLFGSDDANKKIKLEDLSKLVQNMEANFMDIDSPDDEPIIVVNESKEEADKTKDIHATSYLQNKDTSVPKPSSLSSLQTELKELPTKFSELTREIKELKKHVHDLEIELPGDLKEIPNKLETFTSTVESLTT
nr:hypothetical protein [Tanacetum cinerariifolium]